MGSHFALTQVELLLFTDDLTFLHLVVAAFIAVISRSKARTARLVDMAIRLAIQAVTLRDRFKHVQPYRPFLIHKVSRLQLDLRVKVNFLRQSELVAFKRRVRDGPE